MTVTASQFAALAPELQRLLESMLRHVERPVPLRDFADQVLADYLAKARNTRIRMAQALAEAVALAGDGATTAGLTAALVGRFGRREGAASTTNGLLSSLRTACRVAIRRKLLDPSRLEGALWRVKPRRAASKRHHPRADIGKVLGWLRGRAETWDGARLHALAATYAHTGVRKSEALMLKVADLDLRTGFLFVCPNGAELKTVGSAAPVPCPRDLVEVLRAWSGRCGSEWLFPALNRRVPWTGGTAGRRPTDRLVAAGIAAGVPGFTPLSLRHSVATHFASHWGLSEKQIQLILRHTTVLTQRHYVHPDLVNLGELVRDFTYREVPAAKGPPRPDRPRAILKGRKTRRPVVHRSPSADGG